MSVWQRILEDINDPNFVIISAAQDTGGEAVAGPIFDAAHPAYVQIVDENHIVSSAFHFVNVPSAAWVDEEGRLLRIDEGTYAKTHEIGEGDQKFQFGTDAYAPAVKDWAAKGAASAYVRSTAAVAGDIRERSADEQQADAAFRLGNLFRRHGRQEKSEQYWHMARALNPESINFIRQNLTLSEEGSAGRTFLQLMGEYAKEGKPYYRPLDLD